MLLTQFSFALSRRAPELVKKGIRKGVTEALPAGYDVDTDFTPRYDPWDQRLCLVPDGDLFAAISAGRADVVTDTIETFTETGIRLASGIELEADIVVTATGLAMQLLGGITLDVDGTKVVPGESVAYKGIMLCGVPNLATTFGYTNASWTLKADLTAEYVCRLLDLMDERGMRQCTPLPPDPALPDRAVHRLLLGVRDPGGGRPPEAGGHHAVAPPPELPARHLAAALRQGRRRPGAVQPGPGRRPGGHTRLSVAGRPDAGPRLRS